MTRIVVGVDGSEGSVRALEWAVAEAKLRDATVEVVHTQRREGPPEYVVARAGGAALPTDAQRREAGDALLDEVLGRVDSEGLTVQREVVLDGSPAEALVERSSDADLLVVGSRGLGGFTGLLIGSVSQQCLHHARCPTVVVPPR